MPEFHCGKSAHVSSTSADRPVPLTLAADDVERLEGLSTLGQLVAGVAHDLRNIISGVTGHAHLILERPDLPPDIAALAREIVDASRQGTSLARTLVRLGHRRPRQAKVVDVQRLVLDYAGVLRMAAGPRVALNVAAGPPIGRVEVDPADIERVLLNLVINARDAMPQGGVVRLSMSESVVPRPNGASCSFAVVEVRDTGAGMDAATMARMFEPFFTTKEDFGTGLGLAIVQQLVSASGGFLEVESAVGQGTLVRICVPLARPDRRVGQQTGR